MSADHGRNGGQRREHLRLRKATASRFVARARRNSASKSPWQQSDRRTDDETPRHDRDQKTERPADRRQRGRHRGPEPDDLDQREHDARDCPGQHRRECHPVVGCPNRSPGRRKRARRASVEGRGQARRIQRSGARVDAEEASDRRPESTAPPSSFLFGFEFFESVGDCAGADEGGGRGVDLMPLVPANTSPYQRDRWKQERRRDQRQRGNGGLDPSARARQAREQQREQTLAAAAHPASRTHPR